MTFSRRSEQYHCDEEEWINWRFVWNVCNRPGQSMKSLNECRKWSSFMAYWLFVMCTEADTASEADCDKLLWNSEWNGKRHKCTIRGGTSDTDGGMWCLFIIILVNHLTCCVADEEERVDSWCVGFHSAVVKSATKGEYRDCGEGKRKSELIAVQAVKTLYIAHAKARSCLLSHLVWKTKTSLQ
jgi:hypothetical protein